MILHLCLRELVGVFKVHVDEAVSGTLCGDQFTHKIKEIERSLDVDMDVF